MKLAHDHRNRVIGTLGKNVADDRDRVVLELLSGEWGNPERVVAVALAPQRHGRLHRVKRDVVSNPIIAGREYLLWQLTTHVEQSLDSVAIRPVKHRTVVRQALRLVVRRPRKRSVDHADDGAWHHGHRARIQERSVILKEIVRPEDWQRPRQATGADAARDGAERRAQAPLRVSGSPAGARRRTVTDEG